MKIIFFTCFLSFAGSTGIFGQNHLQLLDLLQKRNLHEIDSLAQISWNALDATSKERSMKHYMRWWQQMAPRVDNEGNILNFPALNYQNMQNYLERYPSHDRSPHGSWASISPVQFSPEGPANGRLNCIAVHPNNPDKLFVGSAIGGIWTSDDAGQTWSPMTDGFPSIAISDIVIHPNNPNIMYALTGDGDSWSMPSVGILKSVNGGRDWQMTDFEVPVDELRYGYKLMMHPSDPQTQYLVFYNALHRTYDGWNTSELIANGAFRDLEFHPANPDVLYASTTGKLLKSVNGGDSWTVLNDLDNGLPEETSHFDRVAISVTPASPYSLYVIFADNTPDSTFGYYELYYSSDSGQSFQLQSAQNNITSDQCHYNLDILADPVNNGRVYLGAVHMYHSSNYGQTFTKISGGNNLPDIHADVHCIQFEDDILYICTDGGLSRSSNKGLSFINLSDGLNIMQFYDIDVAGQKIIGGTQDNGTNRWDIGDMTGTHVLGGDGMECAFHEQENFYYASTQNERTKILPPHTVINITPPGHTGNWWAPWLIHPTRPDTSYASCKDLARTYNKGEDWQILLPGFSSTKNITAMAQGISNENVLYIAKPAELRKTTNLHAVVPVWTDITGAWNLQDNGGPRITAIGVDPDNTDRVWVTFSGYEEDLKVMYSSTGGVGLNAWQNLTGSLPNIPVLCIVTVPGTENGVYLGTDMGVFYRDNSLSDWIYFSNKLPRTQVMDLKIDGNYLYAGTYGRGIWRSDLYSACPSSITHNSSNDPGDNANTGTRIYSAGDMIQSSWIINGGVGTEFVYKAGQSVSLLEGFHAQAFSEFVAMIGGCP